MARCSCQVAGLARGHDAESWAEAAGFISGVEARGGCKSSAEVDTEHFGDEERNSGGFETGGQYVDGSMVDTIGPLSGNRTSSVSTLR